MMCLLFSLGLMLAQHHAPAPAVAEASAIASPQDALRELKVGNNRFIIGKRTRSIETGKDKVVREKLAKGQKPFAVIVTCSDSRLMDNVIFDQEMGQLFTIREAGNVPDIQGLASIEYAVEHLGSKLVVVLGHSECGAVKAVHEAQGKPMPGNLWSLQASMAGLLESTPRGPQEDPKRHVTRLCETNARRAAQSILDRSEIVRHLVKQNKVQVVPAFYHLHHGTVEFYEPLKLVEHETVGH